MFASLRVLSVVFSVLVVLCHTASLVVLGETRSSQSEATLRNYLESSSSSSSSPPSGKFYVQGWRWHTMSLVREAGRLREFAQNLSSSDAEAADTDKLSALKTATEYVVNFNMKGLHSIEKDLFFPWVREKTCNAVEDKDKDVCQAIKNVMDELESDRQKLESVGASLVSRQPNSFIGVVYCTCLASTISDDFIISCYRAKKQLQQLIIRYPRKHV